MTMMIMRMTASTGPITQSISGSSLCLVIPLCSFTLSDSENGLDAKIFCRKWPEEDLPSVQVHQWQWYILTSAGACCWCSSVQIPIVGPLVQLLFIPLTTTYLQLNDNSPCKSAEQIHIPEASLLGCCTLIKKCPSNLFEQFIFSSFMTAASVKYVVHLSSYHYIHSIQWMQQLFIININCVITTMYLLTHCPSAQPAQSTDTVVGPTGVCYSSRCISSHHPEWRWLAECSSWLQCEAAGSPGSVSSSSAGCCQHQAAGAAEHHAATRSGVSGCRRTLDDKAHVDMWHIKYGQTLLNASVYSSRLQTEQQDVAKCQFFLGCGSEKETNVLEIQSRWS